MKVLAEPARFHSFCFSEEQERIKYMENNCSKDDQGEYGINLF